MSNKTFKFGEWIVNIFNVGNSRKNCISITSEYSGFRFMFHQYGNVSLEKNEDNRTLTWLDLLRILYRFGESSDEAPVSIPSRNAEEIEIESE